MRALLYIFLLVAFCCQGVVIVTNRTDEMEHQEAVRALLDEYDDSVIRKLWTDYFRQRKDSSYPVIFKRRPMVRVSFKTQFLTVEPFCYNQDSTEIAYLKNVLGDDYVERITRRMLTNMDTLRILLDPRDYNGYCLKRHYLSTFNYPIIASPWPDSIYTSPENYDMDLLRIQLEDKRKSVHKTPYYEEEKGIPFLEYPLKELLRDSVKPDSTWRHPIFG